MLPHIYYLPKLRHNGPFCAYQVLAILTMLNPARPAANGDLSSMGIARTIETLTEHPKTPGQAHQSLGSE